MRTSDWSSDVCSSDLEATFYLLNEKRRELREIEELYGVDVEILPDGETEGARMVIEASGPPPTQRRSFAPIAPIEDDDDDIVDEAEEEDEDEEEERRSEEHTSELQSLMRNSYAVFCLKKK